jgi:tetratricopeptide (TPR) repeat protein
VTTDLVALANEDPARALAEADARRAAGDDGPEVSWARGLALRNLRRIDEAVGELEGALDAESDGDLHTGIALTLAGALDYAGRLTDGVALLDGLVDVPAALAGRVLCQKAVLLERLGDRPRAREGYVASLAAFGAAGDAMGRAVALGGLGLLDVDTGRHAEAAAELAETEAILDDLGLDAMAAFTTVNRGYAALRAGDVVSALRLLDAGRARLDELGEEAGIEGEMDRVEALVLAGLAQEAAVVAADLVRRLTELGMETDRAEGLLVLSSALVGAGRTEPAVRAAAAAGRLFAAQVRSGWVPVAELAAVRAGGTTDATAALALADRLAGAGFTVRSTDARLLAAAATDDPALVRAALAPVVAAGAPDLLGRLRVAEAEARIASADGDAAAALAAADAGLALVDAAQLAVADAETRAGLTRAADDLATIGRRLAWAGGDPSTVAHWLVRTTGAALRNAPVLPPADAERLAVLDRLRHASAAGDDRAVAELLPRLRGDAASADVAVAAEAPDVVLGVLDGGLVAVVGGRCTGPAPVAPVLAAAAGLRLALDSALRDGGGALDGPLDALAALLGVDAWPTGTVRLVPPPELSDLPWGALGARAGRAATVELGAPRPPRGPGAGALAVAGPDLTSARAEADAVAAIHGGQARHEPAVAEVAAALAGVAVLHIAAHGTYTKENPLLNGIRLRDATLFGYDIERIADPPRLVVAASCESGRAVTRPGGELLGLVPAWLAAGVEAVVASAGVLPDAGRTTTTMVALHERLRDGAAPATALAALVAEPKLDRAVTTALVCVARPPAQAAPRP